MRVIKKNKTLVFLKFEMKQFHSEGLKSRVCHFKKKKCFVMLVWPKMICEKSPLAYHVPFILIFKKPPRPKKNNPSETEGLTANASIISLCTCWHAFVTFIEKILNFSIGFWRCVVHLKYHSAHEALSHSLFQIWACTPVFSEESEINKRNAIWFLLLHLSQVQD